jgi:hypothetical protein
VECIRVINLFPHFQETDGASARTRECLWPSWLTSFTLRFRSRRAAAVRHTLHTIHGLNIALLHQWKRLVFALFRPLLPFGCSLELEHQFFTKC